MRLFALRARSPYRVAADRRGFTMIEILFVLAIMGLVAGIGLPIAGTLLAGLRLSGDARSIANAVSLSKIQAAANYTRARLYVDLSGGTFHNETWQKPAGATPGTWVTQGGTRSLANAAEKYGFGIIGTPPPNTQGAIGQASACLDAGGNAIANTACVLFNSRGVPVDSTGAPTGNDALYLTDGTAVYGITVSATGLVNLWKATPAANPTWVAK